MPIESEQSALDRIRAYLDAGHSLDAIREAGWAEWIDLLEANGYDLRTGRLAIAPPADDPPYANYEQEMPASYGRPREAGGIRRSLGMFLLGISGVLQIIFMILLVGSAATGIWWPLTVVIIDNPVSVLWWVPLGFLLTSLSWAIARFIYGLIIGMPLVMLTSWLLGEEA